MKYCLLILIACVPALAKGQNVGIGTANPNMALHIKNSSNLLLLENTTPLAAGVSTSIYFKTGGYYTAAIKTVGQPGAYARLGLFTLTDANYDVLQERLSILDNGNVGIGNTSPAAALSIKSGDKALEVDNALSFNTGISSGLYFKIAGKQTNSIRSIGVGTTQARLGLFSGTSDNSDNQAEIMSVTDNGVGIDTKDPAVALHIKAASFFWGTTFNDRK